MKLSVFLALVATADAAKKGCVDTGTADAATAKKDATAALTDAQCACDAGCTLCKAPAATPAAGAAALKGAADACYTCTAPKVLEKDKTIGKCVDAPAKGTEGKAAEGGKCDTNKDKMGCADTLQCGTTKKVEAKDGKKEVPAKSVCVKSADCSKAEIECGALKLGASLVAAVAIASYM